MTPTFALEIILFLFIYLLVLSSNESIKFIDSSTISLSPCAIIVSKITSSNAPHLSNGTTLRKVLILYSSSDHVL